MKWNTIIPEMILLDTSLPHTNQSSLNANRFLSASVRGSSSSTQSLFSAFSSSSSLLFSSSLLAGRCICCSKQIWLVSTKAALTHDPHHHMIYPSMDCHGKGAGVPQRGHNDDHTYTIPSGCSGLQLRTAQNFLRFVPWIKTKFGNNKTRRETRCFCAISEHCVCVCVLSRHCTEAACFPSLLTGMSFLMASSSNAPSASSLRMNLSSAARRRGVRTDFKLLNAFLWRKEGRLSASRLATYLCQYRRRSIPRSLEHHTALVSE